MSSSFSEFLRAASSLFKGKTELVNVFWPWLLLFLFLDYFVFALRPTIATTPGGAVFGMIAFTFFSTGIPLWFYCVWRNAKNTTNTAWTILALASLLLIAYYAFKRLHFLFLIMTG